MLPVRQFYAYVHNKTQKVAMNYYFTVNNGCGRNVIVGRDSDRVYAIQSPNYPSNYPNNARCEWNFVFDPTQNSAGLSLRMDFPEPLNIEPHRSCIFDAVEVRKQFIFQCSHRL